MTGPAAHEDEAIAHRLSRGADQRMLGDDGPATVIEHTHRRTAPPVLACGHGERVPLRPLRHERHDVFGDHRTWVCVEDADRHAQRRPAGKPGLAPGLVQLSDAERGLGAGQRHRNTTLGLRDRHARWPQAQPKCPEIRVVVVGIEGVEVPVPIDGRTRRAAALQRLQCRGARRRCPSVRSAPRPARASSARPAPRARR